MASLPSASQLITASALALASLSIGYTLGQRSWTQAKPPALTILPPVDAPSTSAAPSVDNGAEPESEEEDGGFPDGDLSTVKAGWTEPCKLVLVVRTDLGMSSGKIAAQCSHATLACYKALNSKNPGLVRHWERTGQAKIALKASSEDELVELEAVAKSLNLCARAIHDAGRTQVAAGSRTVLGIGPGPVELINRVTGKLRLL